jgi:hypothetical protein
MAAETKPSFKEARADTLGFIQGASAEDLLRIAAGTALRTDPLLQSFNPADPAKTEELRKRICHEWKRHADFRGMVIRTVAGMQVQQKGSQKPEQGQEPGQKKGK